MTNNNNYYPLSKFNLSNAIFEDNMDRQEIDY